MQRVVMSAPDSGHPIHAGLWNQVVLCGSPGVSEGDLTHNFFTTKTEVRKRKTHSRTDAPEQSTGCSQQEKQPGDRAPGTASERNNEVRGVHDEKGGVHTFSTIHRCSYTAVTRYLRSVAHSTICIWYVFCGQGWRVRPTGHSRRTDTKAHGTQVPPKQGLCRGVGWARSGEGRPERGRSGHVSLCQAPEAQPQNPITLSHPKSFPTKLFSGKKFSRQKMENPHHKGNDPRERAGAERHEPTPHLLVLAAGVKRVKQLLVAVVIKAMAELPGGGGLKQLACRGLQSGAEPGRPQGSWTE